MERLYYFGRKKTFGLEGSKTFRPDELEEEESLEYIWDIDPKVIYQFSILTFWLAYKLFRSISVGYGADGSYLLQEG